MPFRIRERIEGERNMKTKTTLNIMLFSALILCLPISLYITYYTLKTIQAKELVWFLFFINVPLITFIHVLSKIVESIKDE